MSVQAIDAAVKQKLLAEYNDTPVAFDNEYFDSTGKDAFVRLSMMPNTPYYIGSKCYRELGFIVFSIFIQREASTDNAYRIAKILSDIFKIKKFDGITTGLPDINRVGINKSADRWFQVNVFISYHYDTK